MRAKKKYYFIYMTKNLINGKSYVGAHSTDNLDDNYLGSGVYLKNALKKYKRKNFVRGILEFCSQNDWEEKEQFWIKKMNTEYPLGYNLTLGGEGGIGKIFFEHSRVLMSKTRRERNLAKGKNNGMYGNNHSLSSKQSMSKTRKEREVAKGKNNVRFDHNIYTFCNTFTGEKFTGHKYDLAQKINSNSSALNTLIKGYRHQHKNWIYESQNS